MIFNPDRPIFLQISDRICDEILSGLYPEEARIPGVRDYSILLEVNANTAVKAYEHLARSNIIYKKRGMGYYVTIGAKEKIKAERRQKFVNETLPDIFRQMKLMDVDIEELVDLWKKQ